MNIQYTVYHSANLLFLHWVSAPSQKLCSVRYRGGSDKGKIQNTPDIYLQYMTCVRVFKQTELWLKIFDQRLLQKKMSND